MSWTAIFSRLQSTPNPPPSGGGRLRRKFDDFVWFDETRAEAPLRVEGRTGPYLPETHPLGV